MFVVRLDVAREEDLVRVDALAAEKGALIRRVEVGDHGFVLFDSDSDFESLRECFVGLPAVSAFEHVDTAYVLSSRQVLPRRTRLCARGELEIGGDEFVVMAGPCTVETGTQVATIANAVRASGARVLRGGAFKPRTSPFSFQGRGIEGLELLRSAGQQAGLFLVSEAMSEEEVGDVASAVDMVQVGMRNGLNYSLLEAIGRNPARPWVLLKRGIGSTLDEFLAAADYVLAGGNPNVILCLRGTIDFSKHSRSALNIADIPALRRMTHLPIVVDPSHAAGHRDLVPAMSAAALVAGADGLLVEVHHEPERAWVDGPQSLTLDGFDRLMHRLRVLAPSMGRWIDSGKGADRLTGHPMDELCLEPPARAGAHLRSVLEDHEELQA